MKKILILSYYFPPCNIISSQRPQSFANNFAENGLFPIVVTRHWSGDEKNVLDYQYSDHRAVSIEKNEGFDVIRLPYFARFQRRFGWLLRYRLASKLIYAPLYALGIFDPECDADDCFRDFLRDYLSENPVDFLLVTATPINTIKLGHMLADEFRIPLVADFRDLWNNQLLNEKYHPDLTSRYRNFFLAFHLRRWLRSARLITSVSVPVLEGITQNLRPPSKTLVITNGFEQYLFDSRQKPIASEHKQFVFSVVGTLHTTQDLSVMIEGLRIFLRDKNLEDIRLNFVGTAALPDVKKLLEANLPTACTFVTDRIPRSQALAEMQASDVLFYAGWRGFRGIASGKIYEYLGARRNILIAPNDRDVIESIIAKTDAGKIADTPEEFAKIMNAWFVEWKSTGKVEYRGIEEQIEKYTREKQAEKLALEILKLQ